MSPTLNLKELMHFEINLFRAVRTSVRFCCSSRRPTQLTSTDCNNNHRKFFITTPIFYVNAEPHLGHLYSAVIADAHCRYVKLKGKFEKHVFSTGTDEHGLKIEKAAKASGSKDTLKHCNNVSSKFKNMADEFSIGYTDFIRTTEIKHKAAVHAFWEGLMNKNLIYKSKYEGWYNVSEEAFVPDALTEDKFLANGSSIKVCSGTGHVVEWASEVNYLFKLTDFIPDVKKWIIESKPIKPEKFHHIILQWIDEGFSDLSVSRPASRSSWGVEVPNDSSQIIYVWLDALINYLTAVGYPSRTSVWPPSVQVVGKDILKFHGIYWPAFLIANDLNLPEMILCHSHWTVDNKKMSKSLGNVVNPFELKNTYGSDGLRYFLLREGTPHSDANFNEEKLRRLLNAELADTFGNLVSRCSGKSVNPEQIWPEWGNNSQSYLSAQGLALKTLVEDLPSKVDEAYGEFNFYRGLEQIMTVIRAANLFVETTKPWVLAKSSPQNPELLAMLSIVFETLRVSSIMLLPVIPNLASQVLDRLNVPAGKRKWDELSSFIWTSDKHSQSSRLGDVPSVVYKRIRQ